MSFVEFLLEYYIYILIVLILLIVTVIGFIVDSKNKEKLKNDKVIEKISGTNSKIGIEQSSQMQTQNNQMSINNISQEQLQNVPIDNTGVVSTVDEVAVLNQGFNDGQNHISQPQEEIKSDNVINNSNMNDVVNNGIPNVQLEQQVVPIQGENNISFQNINASNQNMNNGINAMLNNHVGMTNVSNLESSVQQLSTMQPNLNAQSIQNPQLIQKNQQLQGMNMLKSQNEVVVGPNTSVNLQSAMPNSSEINSKSVNNVEMVNGMLSNFGVSNNAIVEANFGQSNMLNPMSIETVNLMSNSDLMNDNAMMRTVNGQSNVQNTSMPMTNYNNVISNSHLTNGMLNAGNAQNFTRNVEGVNNTYQGNNNGNMNTFSGVMPADNTKNLTNSNVVVTTEGAKPFDVSSMFVNNQ